MTKRGGIDIIITHYYDPLEQRGIKMKTENTSEHTEFFLISQFAMFRNVHVSSLRYFEKLGVLKPAKIDQWTGYRYYTLDQLVDLDAILMCIDAGIPLRELQNFLETDSSIRTKSLVEYGAEKTRANIELLQNKLKRMDYVLKYIEDNRQYKEDEFYNKKLDARKIITVDTPPCRIDSNTMQETIAKLYQKANEAGFLPLYPIGLLIHYENGEATIKMYLSVIGESGSAADTLVLPAGNYRCTRFHFDPGMDIYKEVTKRYGQITQGNILVENMFFDICSSDKQLSEIQLLQ